MSEAPASPDVAVDRALRALGCRVSGVSRGYLHATCPLAAVRHEGGADAHPSFGVSVDQDATRRPVGHAHCFSCGFSGHVREAVSLCQAYGVFSTDQTSEAFEALSRLEEGAPLTLAERPREDPRVPEAWLSRFGAPTETACAQYLNRRGVPVPLARDRGVLWDWYRARVVFPVRDRLGRLRGATGRAVDPDAEPRYLFYNTGTAEDRQTARGYTWLGEDQVDVYRPVVVVEGPFDLLSVARVYDNVACSLFSTMKAPASGWHAHARVFVTMYDAGRGGDVARARLRHMCRRLPVRIYDCPLPPGRKDPGECTAPELYDALREMVDRPLRL